VIVHVGEDLQHDIIVKLVQIVFEKRKGDGSLSLFVTARTNKINYTIVNQYIQHRYN
jgi:hypothetical protein